MRLTKRHLKQIIKEEVQHVLLESTSAIGRIRRLVATAMRSQQKRLPLKGRAKQKVGGIGPAQLMTIMKEAPAELRGEAAALVFLGKYGRNMFPDDKTYEIYNNKDLYNEASKLLPTLSFDKLVEIEETITSVAEVIAPIPGQDAYNAELDSDPEIARMRYANKEALKALNKIYAMKGATNMHDADQKEVKKFLQQQVAAATVKPKEPKLDFKMTVGMRCSGGLPLPPPKCRKGKRTIDSKQGPHGYDHCPKGWRQIPVGCPKGETVETIWQLPDYVKKVKDPFTGKYVLWNERTGRFFKMPGSYSDS